MAFINLSMNPGVMSIMQTLLYGGMAMLPILIMDYALLDELSDRLTRVQQNEEYDFIVVGGGTSGAVVANRLSETHKVLLLEAGGQPNPLQSIPAAAGIFLNSPSLDWRFLTVPQNFSCFSLNNQQSLWPRGKELGGTSQLNFMAYVRGHWYDYENWSHLTGDDRWSYEKILPYLKRSENYNGPYDDEKYHGHGGELNLEPDTDSPLTSYFLDAATQMGYSRVDLNAPFQEGFGEFVFTKKNGRRWSSYSAFLEPIQRSRGNRLTIRKYSLVTKVLFKGANNLAYGVEYDHHGVLYVAKARKEIILSSGTVNTPKILMQSGIGPEKHLLSLGIQPVVNLPGVGQNLMDHIIGFTGPFVIGENSKKLTFLLDRDSSPSHLLNYAQTGRGPLSSSGVQASGFIVSNHSNQRVTNPKSLWPDIQLLLFGLPVHNQGPQLFSQLFNLRPEVSEKFYRPVAGKDSFHIMSIISRPKSRGQILLKSSNPKEPPLINPNYLSHPDDVAVIAEGMKKAVELVETTESFQSIGAKLSETPLPTCADLEFRSDDYWSCYIKQFTLSVYHPVGTAKMGKVGDPATVVDSTLKVQGVERLRVIDASIMPQIISSNVQSACYGIAERGAQFIKDDWK